MDKVELLEQVKAEVKVLTDKLESLQKEVDSNGKESNYRFFGVGLDAVKKVSTLGNIDTEDRFNPIDNNHDLLLRDFGNLFETGEDAKHVANRTKVNNLLWAFAKKANKGWKYSDDSYSIGWYVYYVTGKDNIKIGNLRETNSGEIFFRYKEDLQRAINFIGEQVIIDAFKN